ncbi:MAG: hypothetical protein AABX98_00265 [Nanoarchaeota archaeon]
MAVVGFNFTKIVGEKKADPTNKLNIDRSVNLQKVEESHLNIGTQRQSGLVISFLYAVKYAPELGSIDLNGNLFYLAPDDKIKEALDSWKEKTILPKDVMNQVLQAIFIRSNIQALIVSKDLALPPPFPLPSPKVR